MQTSKAPRFIPTLTEVIAPADLSAPVVPASMPGPESGLLASPQASPEGPSDPVPSSAAFSQAQPASFTAADAPELQPVTESAEAATAHTADKPAPLELSGSDMDEIIEYALSRLMPQLQDQLERVVQEAVHIHLQAQVQAHVQAALPQVLQALQTPVRDAVLNALRDLQAQK